MADGMKLSAKMNLKSISLWVYLSIFMKKDGWKRIMLTLWILIIFGKEAQVAYKRNEVYGFGICFVAT